MSEETSNTSPSLLNTDNTQTADNSDNSNNTQSSSPSPSIRKDLVDHAVNFLTDSRIVNASDEKKRSFLKSKGMTDEEIEHAFTLASNGFNIIPIFSISLLLIFLFRNQKSSSSISTKCTTIIGVS